MKTAEQIVEILEILLKAYRKGQDIERQIYEESNIFGSIDALVVATELINNAWLDIEKFRADMASLCRRKDIEDFNRSLHEHLKEEQCIKKR